MKPSVIRDHLLAVLAKKKKGNWKNEAKLTEAIALEIFNAIDYETLWGSGEIGKKVPIVSRNPSWKEPDFPHKEYDFGFAQKSTHPIPPSTHPIPPTPDAVLNVKRHPSSNPSQDRDLFLADAVAAGLERRRGHNFVHACVVHWGGKKVHNKWKELWPDPIPDSVGTRPNFQVSVSLTPSNSPLGKITVSGVTTGVKETELVDTNVNRIMTGGTNAQLLGAFKRPGEVTFNFDVYYAAFQPPDDDSHPGGWVMVFEPTGVRTSKLGKRGKRLFEWWP